MSGPSHFLFEGIDRVGKDTLIRGVQDRLGYHQVFHYQKPLRLDFYAAASEADAKYRYQESSFRTMFQFLCGVPSAKIICNRSHLGESIYAPLYRGYSGEYVFDLEREFNVDRLLHVRLVLLVEDLTASKHFVDDGQSLGGADDAGKRQSQQDLFRRAIDTSSFRDKRIVCVTDEETGKFRSPESILDEVLR